MSLYDPEQLSVQWWKLTGDAAGTAAYAVAKAIEDNPTTTARRRQNLRHARLYANRDLSSIYDYGVVSNYYHDGVYLTMNLVQSCSDTIVSKVCRSKPRGTFLTERGRWSDGRAAKQMTQFCDGVYHANRAYAEFRQVELDSTLFGTGVLWGSPDMTDEVVRLERGLSDEVLVDESEAVNGRRNVRNLFRKQWVHREALVDFAVNELGLSPRSEAVKNIKVRRGEQPGSSSAAPAGAGCMIAVYTGYHLPYREGGEDGRRVIVIDGATLDYGPWALRRFPAEFLDWERPLAGFWGRSLAEGLVPIQLKLNDVIENIDAAHDMAKAKVFVQEGMLNYDSWTNAFMEVIKVNGRPADAVQIVAPATVPPTLLEEREHWWKHGFEFTGISALSAFGEKPAGLTSGAALREVLDRDDLRFTPKGQAYEEFGGQGVPDLVVQLADQMHTDLKKNKKRLTVQVPVQDKWLKTVDWEKIALPKQRFTIIPQPTSTLPTTPGARKEYALELYQAEAIDRPQFLAMLELPDTAKRMDLVLAHLEVVDRAMELIQDERRYEAPEEYGDPKTARAWAMQHYLLAKLEDAPDDVLDLMSRYIDECSEMLAEPAASPPVEVGMDGQPMQADPAAQALVEPPAPEVASTEVPLAPQALDPALNPDAMPAGGPAEMMG